MTLFEECVEALSDDFSLLSEEKEKEVLNIFYKYPFEYGNINKLKEGIVSVEFDELIKLVEEKVKSSEVYVLADINLVPIFKTNLFLALEKIDDISALSTKVFLLGDGYLAQIVSRKTPLDIVALNSE
ncbi:MAG: hypothetical protein E7J23_05935 [Haemophilus parainfluenzae]|jgi:hypothetical protein entcl_4306|uniref:CDI toxin immunity protein n=1 Tax=uncultured Haemophilus sp. TaxID=237779 RepID=UPI002803D636|nr:hypothetical protein [uncultured Haemophilus sp.]MDU4460720.1 hypothetical protein [Haemophilus parainfluenzae]MDU4566521.1 hypothetical protein [Haemophilus parainfluenzae]MDU4638430.1 hypothetical protein [Haemophilus parainfluenzae]MDU5010008.1 hypothetical protein [Haemophilus parainfluenzae]MDU5991135.1 hypothetical protein [Haemophilus parainfluenzae]